MDPQNAASFNSRALALDRTGSFEGALEDFSKVADSPGGFLSHSRPLLILLSFCPSQAIELEPTNGIFFHNRGFTYRNMFVIVHSSCVYIFFLGGVGIVLKGDFL